MPTMPTRIGSIARLAFLLIVRCGRWPGSGRLPVDDAEREVCGTGGVDHPCAFQPDVIRILSVEQPGPDSEQHVSEVDPQLVEQPGFDELMMRKHTTISARGSNRQ